MKSVTGIVLIISATALAGCAGATDTRFAGQRPDNALWGDNLSPRKPTIVDCVHVAFPQCTGADGQ